METRTILQITLGIIAAAVIGLGAYIAYSLTREAETTVVKEVLVDAEEPEAPVNPWSDKGEAAVALVKRVDVTPPLFPDAEENKKRSRKKKAEEPPEIEPVLGAVLEDDKFVADVLKIKGERLGWRAQWWGETKYGPHYFLVRYVFKDADILIGPAWLVDLKNRRVVPKNLPAQVAENPSQGMKSEYYDKKRQIVSTIANHRFGGGMSLAGALLVYFEQESETAEGDTIEGWTIDHDRGNLFKAYFQWVQGGQPVYAEFEFDFDAKALKPVNLQAASIMRVGEDFDRERVSIMPATYDPKARGNRWMGASRKQCRARQNRARCDALATILNEGEVIESLEWLLTARSEGPEAFEQCKEERKCSWRPVAGDGKYAIKYVYNLDGGEERSVTWEVDLKTKEIKPTDRISSLAFSAIRPR